MARDKMSSRVLLHSRMFGIQRQCGQSLIIGLVAIVSLFFVAVGFVNVGVVANNKITLTNAVDAAAYSAGIWGARHLNFLAYTNRAMISNHLAAGHMVAYISWLRYTNKQVQTTNAVLRYAPYVGPVSDAVARIISQNKQVAEDVVAPAYLAQLSATNQLIHAAQVAAKIDQVARSLPLLVGEVGRSFDDNIVINDPVILGDIPSIFKVPAAVALVNQYRKLINFTTRYTPETAWDSEQFWSPAGENDCHNYARGEGCTVTASAMQRMANDSMLDSQSAKWLHQRSHTKSFTELVKLKKRSKTKMVNTLDNWEQEDRMSLSIILADDVPMGRDSAKAKSLYPYYEGISGFIDLDQAIVESMIQDDQPAELDMEFVASVTGVQLPGSALLDTDQAGSLYAKTAVKIFYERPSLLSAIFPRSNRFQQIENERANLYNPFWQATLTDSGWL